MNLESDEWPTLRQIGYFLAVVEHGSITAAARAVHLSQPAISRQIQDLEQRVGGPVIERSAGRLQLTPAGRALATDGPAALSSVRRAVKRMRQAIGIEGGTLELVTLSTLAAGRLLPALTHWRERYQEVSVRLHEFSFRSQVPEAVLNGLGDIGIGTVPRSWPGPVRELGWSQLVAVLPPHDPLITSAEPILVDDLAARDWVLYDERQGLSELVLGACARAGFRPRGVVKTTQVEAAARFAAAGLGVALVPEQNVPPDLAAFVRQLRQPIAWQLAAYARTAWTPAAEAFIEIAARNGHVPQPPDAVDLMLG
ncbi:LysR family transcriptional regulator [Amycolatopsis jejuensis]|uniref:LysR family transcriptional regulator n=1 Tax=Amycolatopsis jejuensis TaxID=330084 RepID=UPI0005275E98|nr:LysR family transcriptional regulator [Amycolatopsis jejuensis]